MLHFRNRRFFAEIWIIYASPSVSTITLYSFRIRPIKLTLYLAHISVFICSAITTWGLHSPIRLTKLVIKSESNGKSVWEKVPKPPGVPVQLRVYTAKMSQNIYHFSLFWESSIKKINCWPCGLINLVKSFNCSISTTTFAGLYACSIKFDP